MSFSCLIVGRPMQQKDTVQVDSEGHSVPHDTEHTGLKILKLKKLAPESSRYTFSITKTPCMNKICAAFGVVICTNMNIATWAVIAAETEIFSCSRIANLATKIEIVLSG